MTSKQRVAIYVRMSKDAAHTGAGIARQERECRELVSRHADWRVVSVYKDNDISAFSGAARPGYEALLAAVAGDTVDLVVVWHTDRLYRRMADLERYIAVCQPAGVPTHAVQAGPLDLTTPSGRMIARTLGAVGQYESEQKGARHRLANAQRVQKGHMQRTRRCFGYELDGSIRKVEAEAIRAGAASILNGGSLAGVARKWNNSGLLPPQGKRRTKAEKEGYAQAVEAAVAAGEDPPAPPPLKPSMWASSSVRLTLRAPRLAGMTTYKGEVVRDTETGEPVSAEWPAILDLATWEALQKALDEIAETKRFPSGDRQLLSGVALCADCGGPMMSGGTRNGRRRYRCRNVGSHVYREAEPIDSLVERAIVRRMSDPEARSLVAPPDARVDVVAIQAQLADLDARQAELGTAFAEGAVTLSQLTAANRKMGVLRAELEAKLPTPTSPAVAAMIDAEDVQAAWDALDADAKRVVIDTLCTVEILAPGTKENAYLDWRERIINPDTVRVTWK